jgi:hypothetical protein
MSFERDQDDVTRKGELTGGAIPACLETMMLSTCRMETATAVL